LPPTKVFAKNGKKSQFLRRCWCSMLSLYNHKPLHQQRDKVKPYNEPEIANHQFGMGESLSKLLPLFFTPLLVFDVIVLQS